MQNDCGGGMEQMYILRSENKLFKGSTTNCASND